MPGFDTGLCACMDDKASCIDVICCMPCQFGRQCNALNDQVNEGNLMYCCLGLICYPGMYIFAGVLRCKVSSKYNLEEHCCVSACLGWYCTLCSLCQTHRQLTLRNAWPGGVCVKQPYSLNMS